MRQLLRKKIKDPTKEASQSKNPRLGLEGGVVQVACKAQVSIVGE